METEPKPEGNPLWMSVIGWILTLLASAGLLASAAAKFVQPSEMVEQFEKKMGWSGDNLLLLGIVEASCVLIYLFPRTAVLGAILLAGYLGGATATHVRIADDFFAPIILGVIVWGGVWLRRPELRRLMPWG